jgi:TonB-linked SusC/RagA family outer membrane protein
MKKTKQVLLLFLMSSFLTITATAQLTVMGKITDATTNEPLPGVSVILKQSAGKGVIGSVTDIKGNFKLEIPESKGVLQLSFVGYKNQEVEVSSTNASSVEVKLTEDVAKLDEVVVTGLATTVKRSNLANSVATISSKDLTGTTLPSTFDAALSGKVVGARIIANSGAPGGGISVKMRGVTTLFGNSQPLYVVDGVYMNNSVINPGLNFVTNAQAGGNPLNQDNSSNRIADLNPSDIENIEILKGASAAAIYGSQAAAGVVIITTKKGQATGRSSINFSQDVGVASAIKLLGVRQFDAEKVQSTYNDSAITAQFNQAQAAGKIYDYEKEMYGEKGFITNSRLSLSGGTERTSFFLAGSVKKENGIVKETGYNYRSMRANIDHKISDRVTLSLNTDYVNSSADRGLTNNDNSGTTWGVALSSTPSFIDLHPDATGNYPSASPFAASNVLQTRDLVKNNEAVNRTSNSLSLKSVLCQNEKTYTKLVLNGGFDFYNLKTFGYFPPSLIFESNGSGTNGANIQGSTNSLNLNMSGFLINYWAPSEHLNLTTSAGSTYESSDLNSILSIASQLIGTQTNLDQAGALTTDQTRNKTRNNGYFAQEELNFKDQLLITGGVRLDKSTNNGDIDKYYTYPKASLAWNVSKMDFWKTQNIDNLKLRLAYGQSGNLAPYGSKFTSLVPANTGGIPGSLIYIQRGNDAIKPERQTELEGGADFSFLKGRLNLEATFYNKKVFDLILLRNVPPSSGFTQEYLNAGDLKNTGIELGLGVIPVQHENIKWESHISFWKNKSKITKLLVEPFTYGGFGNTLGTFYIEEGKSATQIVGIPNDADGNSKVWGDAEPDFQMSFANDVTFLKNFTLSFLVHWKQGGENINLTELLTDLGGTSFDFDADDDGDGNVNGHQRVDSLGATASIFVQNATYVRIREIGLYYNVPSKNLTKFVKGIKIGVSANNYFTWTKYKSYDPEVSNFGINGISSGVEVTPFPSAKRIFFHLSVDF